MKENVFKKLEDIAKAFNVTEEHEKARKPTQKNSASNTQTATDPVTLTNNLFNTLNNHKDTANLSNLTNTNSSNNLPKDTTFKDTPLKDVTTANTVAKENVQNVTDKNVTNKDVTEKVGSLKDAPMKDVTDKETAVNDTSNDVTYKDTANKDAAFKTAPKKDFSNNKEQAKGSPLNTDITPKDNAKEITKGTFYSPPFKKDNGPSSNTAMKSSAAPVNKTISEKAGKTDNSIVSSLTTCGRTSSNSSSSSGTESEATVDYKTLLKQ
jgi:hypothetical protein